MSSSESDATHARGTASSGTQSERRVHRRARARASGAEEITLGHLAGPRGGAERARRRGRARRRRARLRHGVRLGVARAARRASGRASTSRPRSSSTARAAAARRSGSSSRSSRPSAEARAAARRVLRPRRLASTARSIWADPYLWVPEAARLLRPGGRLVFLRNSTLADALLDEGDGRGDERLVGRSSACTASRTPEGRSSSTSPTATGSGSSAASGFEVEDLRRAAGRRTGADATYDFGRAEWARRWPAEEIWKARKR